MCVCECKGETFINTQTKKKNYLYSQIFLHLTFSHLFTSGPSMTLPVPFCQGASLSTAVPVFTIIMHGGFG